MKILCVIDSLGSGGAQRQLVELAKGFKEDGNDVSFLTYHRLSFYNDELLNRGIPIICIEEANYFKRIWKMRAFIRKGKFHAVLSFLEGSNFICELSSFPFRDWKLVVGERSANPKILRAIKPRILRWFHIFADYVVANSYENIKLIKRTNLFMAAQKQRVIYNIVDFNKWSSSEAYIPFKFNKLNLLVVASHQYLKNAKGLIEAISLLSNKEKSKIKIDWYGDESPDNSYTEAKRLIGVYNLQSIFTFHKATIDIADKMQSSDMVGLFSFYEGLPNVICEAMVMGKPVISSWVSDVPSVLEIKDNLIFNPYDVDHIAKSLSYALSLSLEELYALGAKNKKRGYELFEKKKIVSEYLALLS